MGEAGGARRGTTWLPSAILVVLILAIYRQTGSFGAIPLDDHEYVFGNPAVAGGVTPEGVRWAFAAFEQGNWHPLTWLSHMADVSAFGMDAGAHHLVNVAFHLLNTLLLFRFLHRATGRAWEGALAAALFAVHPLHVESVAWIAERKDLLCAFFGFLALNAYAAYVLRPGVARYAIVLLLFAAGLMAKPMLVTFPFLLLLLDFWPFRRTAGVEVPGDGVGPISRASLPVLLLEKIPMIVLSAASSAVALAAQRAGGAVGSEIHFPLALRIGNAIDACAGYLLKTAWPANLAVFYPHPVAPLPWPRIAAGGSLLLAVTVLSVAGLRRRPGFAVGWFWFLGTLVPVSGLVQIGGQAMADRYTYIPLVGLFLAAAMGASSPGERRRPFPGAVAFAALVVVGLLSFLSWRQVSLWRGAVPLFTQAADSTRDNWLAHSILGDAALSAGDDRAAVSHFRELARIRNRRADALVRDGITHLGKGRDEDAALRFREALLFRPVDARAQALLHAIAGRSIEKAGGGPGSGEHAGVAMALAEEGRFGEAAARFRAVLARSPQDPVANYDLAVALWRAGMKGEALPHFRVAATGEATDAASRKRIGASLVRLGRPADALGHFLEVIRQAPGDPEARFDAGIALSRLGRHREAVPHLAEAVRSSGGNDADALLALGEAFEAVGSTEEARECYRGVLKLQAGRVEAVDRLERTLPATGG